MSTYNTFSYIKGVTWGFMSPRGAWETKSAKQSLKLMAKKTGADTVVLAPTAYQANEKSTVIDYTGEGTVSPEEVVSIIELSHSLGLRVILKPILNIKSGLWRAFIDMGSDEQAWKEWFASYEEFILDFARIAESTHCFMFCAGCEMIGTEKREAEWRALLQKIRGVYSGYLTYNTDKYREEKVDFWDAVDAVSASGYYAINEWPEQLSRIARFVEQVKKPFFFMEAGCPSREGSAMEPYNWEHKGRLSLSEQKKYYQTMFDSTDPYPWFKGFGLWDWPAELYPESKGKENDDYCIFGKPACNVVKKYYTKKKDSA